MSSIRFSSFGAATMPLSKVVIDKDLDLRPYGVIARYCKAPVTADDWPTETLEWGDVAAETVLPLTEFTWSQDGESIDMCTADISGYYTLTLEKLYTSNYLRASEIRVNGDTVLALGAAPWSYTLMLNEGDVLSLYTKPAGGSSDSGRCEAVFTGKVGGAITFDLRNKWLAAGLDMHGLNATIKIQGVDIPYSEYLKYFPIAPTELTCPSVWAPKQERPDIKVYK